MNDKKYKIEDLWVIFLSAGTSLFVLATTIGTTWVKMTIIAISALLFLISLIFSIQKYKNKK